jgi:hypothetical protein
MLRRCRNVTQTRTLSLRLVEEPRSVEHRDTLAAPPSEAALIAAQHLDADDDLTALLDRLDALELVAEDCAESASSNAVVFDAAQCALCLGAIRDVLVELHEAANEPIADPHARRAAQAVFRACAARTARVLDAVADDCEETIPRDANGEVVDWEWHVDDVGPHGDLARLRRAAALVDGNLAWLRAHLAVVLPLRTK